MEIFGMDGNKTVRAMAGIPELEEGFLVSKAFSIRVNIKNFPQKIWPIVFVKIVFCFKLK
jgi:hypothetical protein